MKDIYTSTYYTSNMELNSFVKAYRVYYISNCNSKVNGKITAEIKEVQNEDNRNFNSARWLVAKLISYQIFIENELIILSTLCRQIFDTKSNLK